MEPRAGESVQHAAEDHGPCAVTIATIKITLDKVIPPIEPPKDTKYIKHVKMQSKLLSKFWGRPMHLGANVFLPEGFDTHPNARYPLVIFHGHFPATFGGFREYASRSKSET